MLPPSPLTVRVARRAAGYVAAAGHVAGEWPPPPRHTQPAAHKRACGVVCSASVHTCLSTRGRSVAGARLAIIATRMLTRQAPEDFELHKLALTACVQVCVNIPGICRYIYVYVYIYMCVCVKVVCSSSDRCPMLMVHLAGRCRQHERGKGACAALSAGRPGCQLAMDAGSARRAATDGVQVMLDSMNYGWDSPLSPPSQPSRCSLWR
jgi:hypothetical protein